MRSRNRNITIEVRPLLFLWLAAAVILLPVQWVAAWGVAVLVHEFCHYCAIRICGGRVFSVRLGLTGAVLESEQLSSGKEIICALAGPLGGLSALLFAKWLPRTAFCGFVHTAFNLLPIFPMDGGRVLRCIIGLAAPKSNRAKWEAFTANLIRITIALGGIYLTVVLHLGALPVIAAAVLIIKSIKIPCKESKQRVQ